MKEITTERIKLSIAQKSDSEKIHLLRTNPQVAKFIERDLEVSVADVEYFIEVRADDPENILFYKIETIPDLKLVGTVVVKNIDRNRKYAEVGYELFPEFEGQGLMTVALENIIKMTIDHIGLEELEAVTHRDNLKSRKLLERLGFKMTDKKDNKYPESVVYNLKFRENNEGEA